MKTQISSIELHFLVRELQELIDGKVDKIYHPSREEVVFAVHLPNKGKKILKVVAGKAIYLSESREPAEEPTNFCIFLRKHLSNARIREISQLEPERIVKMVFEKKDGKENLVIELFGRGNVILADSDDAILAAIDYHKFKGRTIRPREKYIYPKKEISIFSLEHKGLKEALEKTEKDSTATFLAVDLGIGGIFSEEICLVAGIDKSKKPGDLSAEEQKKILSALHGILRKKPEPCIVRKEGKIIDAVPVRLGIYRDADLEEVESFSLGIAKLFSEASSQKLSPKEKEMERLQRILSSQEEKIKELESAEAENREKAELVFQNYPLIGSILKELRSIEKKHSWHEIKEKLKGHKLIKDVDVKEKKVVLEI